ncbi:MAG: methionine--tRNA ligase [Sandaracinus sp.]
MTTTPFYLTTPIYYVNGKPHVGHAYTTIACDVLTRHARLRGKRTRLLTGTDEHGKKIADKAAEEGLSPQTFVDRLIPSFTSAWEALGIQNDDFLRTTEERHRKVVDELWRRCEASGDIYLGEYEGWYAKADEAYYTEKEIKDGKAIETGATVERVKEKSYFFRLSKYQKPLLDYYAAHPDFVRPEGKFNEVKAFVSSEEGLRDLSISRTTFRWGLPVPGAPDHVIYVWFDALTNYVSALCEDGKIEGAALYEAFWKHGEAVHMIGKEITRFHCVYWPAFLMSAGLPLPRGVFAHGWMTVNNEKMSKTAGNFLPPEPLAEALGKDTLRYYLMRDVALGADSDFSHANMLARYHGDLGNGLGNLLNRMVASIVPTSLGGRVPVVDGSRFGELEQSVIATAERAAKAASEHLAAFAPHRALESAWELVLAANKYVDQTAPWALAKNGEIAKLEVVAYTVLESLRWLSVMLWPVMPEKCDGIRAQLGLPPLMPTEGLDRWPSAWGGLPGGTITRPGAPLFPRLDEAQQRAYYERLGVKAPDALAKKDAPAAKPEKKEKKVSEAKPAAEAKPAEGKALPGVITIDDLDKVEMKLALVKSAERVPKSDKLLELKVDVGEPEPRTILAGIGEHYAPEALVGRRIAVVANLAPRTFAKFGKTSHGMVLAVSDANGLSVLSPDKDITPGVRLK